MGLLPLVRTVIRKELRETVRDRWLCLACSLFSVALCVCVWRAAAVVAKQQSEVTALQSAARQDWVNQPTTNAHMATHHGTTLFKPLSPLSSFDVGVDPLLGSRVRIESHRQGRMTDPRETRDSRMALLAFDSPAMLLDAGLPLFVILLGFSGVAREREQGTVRFLTGNGVSWKALILGKLAAIMTVVAIMAVPVLLLVPGFFVQPSAIAMAWTDLGSRLVLLATMTTLYLLGWAALSLGVSSAAGSPRAAFLILTVLWFGWTIGIPRMAASVAMNRYPVPDWRDLERAREDELRFGNSAEPSDEQTPGMSEAGLTPSENAVSPEGAKLLALERFSDEVYDRFGARIQAAFDAQDRVLSLAGVFSPYLAIREESMLWTGTDRLHHEHFRQAAETYRRNLVRSLNLMEARRERPGSSDDERRAFWSRIPAFEYRFPPASSVWRDALLPTIVLCCWCFIVLLGALRVPR